MVLSNIQQVKKKLFSLFRILILEEPPDFPPFLLLSSLRPTFIQIAALMAFSFYFLVLLEMGHGPELVCLGPADGLRVLDFVQEKFHNTSPGEF